MPFARFMERALYEPGLGYYTAGAARVGRGGDFFTNVSVGPLFGRILARQFLEMRDRLGPGDFALVEQGANDGTLAADVLAALDGSAVDYRIVEPSAPLREKQRAKLAAFAPAVRWFDSLEALPAFTGVHFSNELVDALPFHLVCARAGGWDEWFVTTDGDGFTFVAGPPGPAVADAVAHLPAREDGYLAEVRPAAAAWLRAVSARLVRGFVLVCDYGFPASQLLDPGRRRGTFAAYRGHRRDERMLDDPGEKDLTAHVDFTALARAAAVAGLRFEGWTDQHHFLIGAGQTVLAELSGPPDAARQKDLRALQTLLHPTTMGTQFSFLGFSRGLPAGTPLSGFQFARPCRELADLFPA
jgi:SAM-dependent MidA family methyltransferase